MSMRLPLIVSSLFAAAIVGFSVVPKWLRPELLGWPDATRAISFVIFGAIAGWSSKRNLLRGLILGVLLIVALEFAQALIPTRHAKLRDVAVKIPAFVTGFLLITGAFRLTFAKDTLTDSADSARGKAMPPCSDR